MESESSKMTSANGQISILSVISLAVSIIGIILYKLVFKGLSLAVIIAFVIVALAAITLPPIAKIVRLKQQKQGKILEIIAIVIGGFDFYCVFFAIIPIMGIFFGFLGWVICGIIYAFAGQDYAKK